MPSETVHLTTPHDVVHRLSRQGLVFSSRTHTLVGRFAPADAKWNYNEDMLHIEHVHSVLRTEPIVHGRTFVVHLNRQGFLGQSFPVVMLSFEPAENAHSGIATVFGFCLVGDTRWQRVGSEQTRVDTTYHVGSSRLLRPLHGVVHHALKRNYDRLMREDMPMRLRRGELRGWGYSFRHDDAPAALRMNENVGVDNVKPPLKSGPTSTHEVRISEHLTHPGACVRLGRPDHLGLQLRRTEDAIIVLPRMCMHEGASIDDEGILDRCIRCPWHGRVVRPVAELPLSLRSQRVDTRLYSFERDGDQIRITPRVDASAGLHRVSRVRN